MQAKAAEREPTGEMPKPVKYSLKAPYMQQGRVNCLVAKTANMRIHTKVIAQGGENSLHCHLNEDHSFLVLEGEMTFFDEKDDELHLRQYQGVMIPKGVYYRYVNTGAGNLVLLRIGAGINSQPRGGEETRIRPDGKPLPSRTPENKTRPPIEMSGKFFADSAG